MARTGTIVGGLVGGNNTGLTADAFDFAGMLPSKPKIPIKSAIRAKGGGLYAYGGKFDNGITEFNEGGSHEENPHSGIMQGMGENGKPNFVEEGETK